ncbi:hypothetical protein BDR26DRAFT_721213 [Obelidium mucronatum]|nr:hypothetical protein BDR26DRAFT_721213 [Obelidium mucronatum]
MHYLTSGNKYASAGSLFGMSKTRVHQVVKVLVQEYQQKTIYLPTSDEEWNDGFEAMFHIPNILGAIDWSLFHIWRLDIVSSSLKTSKEEVRSAYRRMKKNQGRSHGNQRFSDEEEEVFIAFLEARLLTNGTNQFHQFGHQDESGEGQRLQVYGSQVVRRFCTAP